MSDLNDLFKVVSEGKKHFEETTTVGQKVKEVKVHVKEDLSDLFAQLASLKEDLVEAESKQEDMIVEDMLIEVSPIPAPPVIRTPEQRIKDTNADVSRYLKDKSFQQPDPDLVSKDVDAIRNKIKFLEQAIGKIAAAGPGSGEVNLRWLDDVARETISDGRWLKYDDSRKKFVFDEINPYEVVYNTTQVTTPTYTVDENDYYIGVDYAGPVTITLPTSANSGRMLIIKDEDGDAEINPITVLGNVDNDAGGFIIQINNGAIQLIYRNGWRIV
jgi:hypothetical protein